MEKQTISQISKGLNLSTRTLRYYEELGLIQSERKAGYAYRVYSEDTIKRLRQILILRKLRIPLKKIAEILKNNDALLALQVFEESMNEVDEEITALSTIRSILQRFIDQLNSNMQLQLNMETWESEDLFHTLAVTKKYFREEKTMEDLNQASQKISQLNDRDVRILYLPPATVASIHCIGGSPEDETDRLAKEFIKEYRLAEIKPDFRHYGFNHPNGTSDNDNDHGYERWLTIPDDLPVREPYVKKTFPGGLYCAHMIPMGAFEEWPWIVQWACNNEKYEAVLVDDGGECMNGLLEEHLNYINLYNKNLSPEESGKLQQIDLLVPIREK